MKGFGLDFRQYFRFRRELGLFCECLEEDLMIANYLLIIPIIRAKHRLSNNFHPFLPSFAKLKLFSFLLVSFILNSLCANPTKI